MAVLVRIREGESVPKAESVAALSAVLKYTETLISEAKNSIMLADFYTDVADEIETHCESSP